ncbi:MAG: alpha/beta hydrolase [Bdellovibrionaceae bacterium]|nr:alpha/beta hydrolase [Pseudobdellovibrionaceae bacterium]
MKIKLIISQIIFIITSPGYALPNYCNSEVVHQIQRPYAKGKKTFSYRYSVRDDINTEENENVVVFVPGGPGQTSMDMLIALPNDFRLVRIDPRGVGCNENVALTDEDFTSEILAQDILAVVRDLHLKKYILHGISYGTVVATMVASLAESQKTVLPQAVVLEGVIGNAYGPDEYYKGYLSVWNRIKPQLPINIQHMLIQEPLPLGLSSKEWAAWITSNLIYGVLPQGDDAAVTQLLRLNAIQKSANDKEKLLSLIQHFIAPPTAGRTQIYTQITCRELVPDVRDVKFDFDLKGGDIVISNQNLCRNIKMDHPFDSKRYPVKSPIYYFSGEHDPVTPISQAQYHFNNQTGTRTWVQVSKGGHPALSVNLADCSPQVWQAIAENSSDKFKTAMQSCAARTSIQHVP